MVIAVVVAVKTMALLAPLLLREESQGLGGEGLFQEVILVQRQ